MCIASFSFLLIVCVFVQVLFFMFSQVSACLCVLFLFLSGNFFIFLLCISIHLYLYDFIIITLEKEFSRTSNVSLNIVEFFCSFLCLNVLLKLNLFYFRYYAKLDISEVVKKAYSYE